MKVQRLIFICAILAFALFLATGVKASEKEEALRRCERLFGKPVNQDPILFEIDRFYVLRADFDDDKLKELTVQPKYDFDDIFSDWKKTKDFTYLSYSEYQRLLLQLDPIKPKGKLVTEATICPVTNQTAWCKNSYENASVIRGAVTSLRRGENNPVEIKSIEIQYEEKAAQ